ncbi:MAG: pyruvate dehydrogenase (acetyl-transferring) E1 component subunit alpha [Saprospiraceae bacterium]|jgi:pyruvate dehydrogenase E1 component alpha subunit|nr:pyruvate dehydrogenase (acetyl-transferring) E1 component subunit alpha [Saprospiraceae bacterium]
MAEVISKKKSTVKPQNKGLNYPKSTWMQWYETILRVRRFEERTLMMYSQQKIRGFCHVYIGQEAIAAAMTTAIRPEDAVVTAYRQHGTALSRGLSARSCMAELYGKATGCVKGKGGSMHFFSREHRYFGGNGIVGAQIPIGTGIAFAEKYKGTENICVTMFGDGAARQGALYESFNMAMTWKLPALYIVENNGYAMGTSIQRTSNVVDLYKIGQAFEMESGHVDGMRPDLVHEALEKAAKYVRSGKGPYFLEIKTYRYRGHSVSDPGNYRTKEELEHYKMLDPLLFTEHFIVSNKIATSEEMESIQNKIKAEVDDAVQFAENSPFPTAEGLYEDNYVESDYPYLI